VNYFAELNNDPSRAKWVSMAYRGVCRDKCTRATGTTPFYPGEEVHIKFYDNYAFTEIMARAELGGMKVRLVQTYYATPEVIDEVWFTLETGALRLGPASLVVRG
jgi:hypothetical protein